MRDAAVIVLLGVHLLAVNLAGAGPLVAAWLVTGSGERGADRALRLMRQSLAALVLGAALGTIMLVVGTGTMRSALARFPASTYWFAASELVFSAACMATMAAGGIALRRRGIAWLLALASATNLLYHFPPLMAVIGKLASDPRWSAQSVITHRTLLALAIRPEVLALWIHFALASVAVAAIAALWPSRGATVESEEPEVQTNADAADDRRLAKLALAATALQLPVGVWVLVTTGGAARMRSWAPMQAPAQSFSRACSQLSPYCTVWGRLPWASQRRHCADAPVGCWRRSHC